MALVPATLPALLDSAREFVTEHRFDAEQVLQLLSAIPSDDLDTQTRGAITHARLVSVTALNKSTLHTAVARFALHRVVVLLEKHAVRLGII